VHLAEVEPTGRLEGALIRTVALPAGPQAQLSVVRDRLSHEGLPGELHSRLLVPLGHADVWVYAEVLDELLRVPQRVWRGRHVVVAPVSGYPPMSNQNVPSPRDSTFWGPTA